MRHLRHLRQPLNVEQECLRRVSDLSRLLQGSQCKIETPFRLGKRGRDRLRRVSDLSQSVLSVPRIVSAVPPLSGRGLRGRGPSIFDVLFEWRPELGKFALISQHGEGEIVEGEIDVEAVGDVIGEAQQGREKALCCKEWRRRLSSWKTTSWRTWTRRRMGPTLLRAAGDLLVQCGRNRLLCGARAYKTVYFEESLMVALKKKGRRRTGGADGDQLKALRLKNQECQRAHGGFHLHAARRGQSRAAQPLHVRPGELPPHTYRGPTRFRSFEELRGRAERRAGKDAPRPNCSKGAVPEAPLRWQHRALGDLARDDDLSDALEFQSTVRALVAEDCSKNRDVLKRLRNETARPRERVVNVVHRLDGNVLAYERDGLFLEFEGDLGLLRNEMPQLSVAAEAAICKDAGTHTLEL